MSCAGGEWASREGRRAARRAASGEGKGGSLASGGSGGLRLPREIQADAVPAPRQKGDAAVLGILGRLKEEGDRVEVCFLGRQRGVEDDQRYEWLHRRHGVLRRGGRVREDGDDAAEPRGVAAQTLLAPVDGRAGARRSGAGAWGSRRAGRLARGTLAEVVQDGTVDSVVAAKVLDHLHAPRAALLADLQLRPHPLKRERPHALSGDSRAANPAPGGRRAAEFFLVFMKMEQRRSHRSTGSVEPAYCRAVVDTDCCSVGVANTAVNGEHTALSKFSLARFSRAAVVR